jgi:hypothetical protein
MTSPSHRSLPKKAKRTYASRDFTRDAGAFRPPAARARYRSPGTSLSFLEARTRFS